jgi:hypothetical protein
MAVVALAATVTTIPTGYQQRKTRGGRERGERYLQGTNREGQEEGEKEGSDTYRVPTEKDKRRERKRGARERGKKKLKMKNNKRGGAGPCDQARGFSSCDF